MKLAGIVLLLTVMSIPSGLMAQEQTNVILVGSKDTVSIPVHVSGNGAGLLHLVKNAGPADAQKQDFPTRDGPMVIRWINEPIEVFDSKRSATVPIFTLTPSQVGLGVLITGNDWIAPVGSSSWVAYTTGTIY